MIRGILIGDNYYDSPRTSIARTNGAHRVAGLLRNKGMKVEVLDFFNSWTIEELEIVLNAHPLDFIGLSFGLGRLEDNKVNSFIQSAKRLNKDIKIIAGGTQVLLNKIDGIDLYFRGFADGAIDDISTYLHSGIYPNELIKLVKDSSDRKIVECNQHYSKFDLSNLRTEYTDNDFLMPNENFTLEFGRGCIFKCKFCNAPLTGKKKNDYIRDKQDIKNEIVENYNRWGITQYSITDETFNDNDLKLDIMHEISQEIDFELSFMCYARVDLLHHKPKSLEKMVSFGVKGMHFGIESLTPAASKVIGKGFSGEPLKNYLKEIKNLYPDLNLLGTFIIGLPNETIEQFEHNIHQAIDEKLLDAAVTFPLIIWKDTGGAELSVFSKEWRKYGYEEMGTEELYELLKEPKYQIFKDMDVESFIYHRVPWKGDIMNFLDADLANMRIRKDLECKTSMGGWTSFTTTYTGIPLSTLLSSIRTEWDWDTIKRKAIEFVDEYKKKKLEAIVDSVK